jgi:hypothetical protein
LSTLHISNPAQHNQIKWHVIPTYDLPFQVTFGFQFGGYWPGQSLNRAVPRIRHGHRHGRPVAQIRTQHKFLVVANSHHELVSVVTMNSQCEFDALLGTIQIHDFVFMRSHCGIANSSPRIRRGLVRISRH